MKYKFNIKNLDCVNCAREVEKSLNEDKKINKAVVNFNTSTITVETDVDDAFSYVKETVAMIEPDAILSEEKIESDNNKDVYRLLIGAVIGILGIVIKISPINMILIVVAYIILIYKTLLTALKQLKNRKINENFLVSISAIGAYLLGKHHEGLMVIFLYELGKMLEANSTNGLLVRGARENFFQNRWFNWSKTSLIYCKKANGQLVAKTQGRLQPDYYTLEGDEGIISPFEEKKYNRMYLDDFDIREFQKIMELK